MLLAFSRAVFESPADSILIELQTQQHLHPHRALSEILETARGQVGFCRSAGDRAMRMLGISREAKIGRLKEKDLIRLSLAIRRFGAAPSQGLLPASVA
jgi:hypothetical protein